MLNDGRRITDMLCDHRIDAKVALLDLNSAIQNAGLTPQEHDAIELVLDCGVYLTDEAKHIFFSGCRKIAEIFREQEYGRLEISKYV